MYTLHLTPNLYVHNIHTFKRSLNIIMVITLILKNLTFTCYAFGEDSKIGSNIDQVPTTIPLSSSQERPMGLQMVLVTFL